ncbi:MAG TPA: hypothetical protein QGF58_12710 [Myxococcota bacterium]|nr:hypothetical protein [Myxococcota bacterium]
MILLLCLGCAAIKATVHLAQLEESWVDAEAASAEARAPYEYTIAQQYRLKAHEEWGGSDYGAAQDLALQARLYAQQAEEMALYGSHDEDAEQRHEVLENLDEDVDVIPEMYLEEEEEEWIELDDIDLDEL